MPFYPGPGVGGHCIAQDPYYLIDRAHRAGFEHTFLKLARSINEAMPSYVASGIEEELKKQGLELSKAKIACLGQSYKPNVDDPRESPAIKVVEILKQKGANPKVFDPFIPEKSNAKSLEEAVEKADCIVLLTDHSLFLEKLSPLFLKTTGAKLVFDARNALDKKAIESSGAKYRGIGR
jgi:UDP-N-acetyl-D-glucosamine dehydrogenase